MYYESCRMPKKRNKIKFFFLQISNYANILLFYYANVNMIQLSLELVANPMKHRGIKNEGGRDDM